MQFTPSMPFVPNHSKIVPGMATGRVRGRRGWFGKMIMQIECYRIKAEYLYPHAPKGEPLTDDDFEGGYWRDATPDDLTIGDRFVFTHRTQFRIPIDKIHFLT